MGQMTFAVLYGCEQAPPKFLEEDGWYSLTEEYKTKGMRPATPCGDGDHDKIGFWVAAGASGMRGVPILDSDFPLDGFALVTRYAEQYKRARAAWATFAAWALDKHGIKLGEPRLWLVQTEVA